MKKKILAVAIAAIMLLTAVASISLAYLTDTDEQDNVFTIGNVKIDQLEYERIKEDGKYTNKIKPFTDKQKIFPAVYDLPKELGGDPARMYDLKVNDYTITLGVRTFPNYVDKIVTVKNTGNSDAYVRTIIAVPVNPNEDASDGNVSENWIHWNAISDSDTNTPNGWYYGTTENQEEYPTMEGGRPDYSKHYIVKNVEINGKNYDLTVITNVLPLEPGDETAPNMVGFYLDNDLNYEDDPEDGAEDGWYMPYGDEDGRYYVISAAEANEGLANKVILVATQAVQCEGFTDAWQAFAASFGEITETNHPWYVEEPAA